MKVVRKVAVIGAGAMGCLFAARLAEAGAGVVVIDVDRARLAAIARDGIVLTDDHGRRTVRVDASVAADFDEPVELVILFTKGMHSGAAIASVDHLRRFKPIALTLQNGIGNADLLAAAFGGDRVIMGTALVPADLTGPNAVETHGVADIQIGPFGAAADGDVSGVAVLLRRAGFTVHRHPRIAAAIWEKVAFNAALNSIGMICEVRNAGIDNEAGRRIVGTVVDETAAVAAARGLDIDREGVLAQVEVALRDHRAHKASMLQDREQGRRSEIESINGAIAAAGERSGVPTPVCDTLVDLVRVIEANYPVEK